MSSNDLKLVHYYFGLVCQLRWSTRGFSILAKKTNRPARSLRLSDMDPLWNTFRWKMEYDFHNSTTNLTQTHVHHKLRQCRGKILNQPLPNKKVGGIRRTCCEYSNRYLNRTVYRGLITTEELFIVNIHVDGIKRKISFWQIDRWGSPSEVFAIRSTVTSQSPTLFLAVQLPTCPNTYPRWMQPVILTAW